MPNFNLITLNVPQPPVNGALPKQISFLVDSRFSVQEVDRIRELIFVILRRWSDHYVQRVDGSESDFELSTGKYATTELEPIWFSDKLANGSLAATAMMTGLTKMIVNNGFKRVPYAEIRYKIPTLNGIIDFIVKAQPGSLDSNLTVEINPLSLNMTNLSNDKLSGSLLHAWMLRMGYRTPPDRMYTSTFIGEASMSFMRGLADKTEDSDDQLIPYLGVQII